MASEDGPNQAVVEMDESSYDLCRACQTLFFDIDLGACVDHHHIGDNRPEEQDLPGNATDKGPRSYAQIKRSRHEGCVLCSMVMNIWEDEYPEHVSDNVTMLFRLSHYEKLTLFGLVVWVDGSLINAGAPGDHCWNAAQIMLSRVERAGSFDLIRSWLKTCITGHDECKRISSSPWLPTRLIDVSNLGRPRLVLSSDIPTEDGVPIYLTLSHRWTDHVVRLTSSRFSEFQTRLPTEDLPQTFLDALIITRRLGAMYLWIDSLCIIQDSEYDWKSESRQMGRIYENGLCNISATAASLGHEFDGLLPKERKPRRDLSASFRIPIQKAHQESLGKTALFRASYGFRDRWDGEVERSPINSRGWVFQERLLSPRTMHFAPSEVFWECPNRFTSESLRGLASSSCDRIPGRFKRPRIDNILDWRVVWRDNVHHYCLEQGFLTKESDRLMALAGVAKTAADDGEMIPRSDKAFPGKYLAGLWEEALPLALGWGAIHRDTNSLCRRPDEYRAPTWTWASLDFQSLQVHNVYGPGYEVHCVPLVKVLDAQVIPQDGFDEFGPLAGGWIILSGRTYPINLAELPASPGWRNSPPVKPAFHFFVDINPTPANLETVADVCLPVYFHSIPGYVTRIGCILLKRDERLDPRSGAAEQATGYVRVGAVTVFFYETTDSTMPEAMPQALRGVISLGRSALASHGGDDIGVLPGPEEETIAIY